MMPHTLALSCSSSPPIPSHMCSPAYASIRHVCKYQDLWTIQFEGIPHENSKKFKDRNMWFLNLDALDHDPTGSANHINPI